MIQLRLTCDRCNREHAYLYAAPRFTPTHVRHDAQREGWRYHKKADLCPECALKVLGVIGAMVTKQP